MTLGSHQRTIGREQARFTPRRILDALGVFDTDASAGDPRPWDIGRSRNITAADDALSMDWAEFGRTWLNPPFDSRIVGGFVSKMVDHNRGIMLLHGRTETTWFQPVFERAAGLIFLRKRVVFLNPDGSPIRIENPTSRYHGQISDSGAPVVLSAFGDEDCEVLAYCGLDGKFIPLIVPRSIIATFIGTWREAVEAIFPEQGEIKLDELYRAFARHPKASSTTNHHPRAKLRQIVQGPGFERVGPGTYRRAE